MIPSVLAQHRRQGVEGFLRTTFAISMPFFHRLVDRLLATNGEAFKGPHVSVHHPLREGTGGPEFLPDAPPQPEPYLY
jgi:DEAD/DEAH box helicase domain-containing protein